MRGLRQVAELAGDAHFAARGQQVTGDHSRERRLAGAIATHQADFVAFGHVEVSGLEQLPRSDADFQLLRLNGHALLLTCR